MGDSTEQPDPPADLPEAVVSALQGLDAHDLRETVAYAQELLQVHHDPTEGIEPAPGEEIVEITEYPEYTVVVKREPCGKDCEECPHGPYVYHVTRERRPDGTEHFHWSFIGRRISEGS